MEGNTLYSLKKFSQAIIFSILFVACQSKEEVQDFTVSFTTCASCFVCSGLKLQKGVILTAAHCFEDVKNPDNIRYQGGASGSARVKDVVIHPQYDRFRANYDIALIILNDAESQFVPNVIFNTLEHDPDDKMYSVSYEPSGSDYKRKTKNHVFLEQVEEQIFVDDKARKDSICKGNSGGPVYVVRDDIFYLAGVISGIDATISQVKGNCNDGFRSRFIGVNDVEILDWVERTISEA